MSRRSIGIFVAAVTLCGATVAGLGGAWSNTLDSGGRPHMTRAEFDQTFADAAAASRSVNTPTNRERLRDAGWKRLNVPVASK